MLIMSRQWERQPQDNLKVSSQLISEGLVALFDLRAGIEVISGQKYSSNTAVNKASNIGDASDYSGTANTVFSHQSQYVAPTALTLFALVEIDALTNSTPIIGKWSGGLLGGVPIVTPYIWELANGNCVLFHGTGSNRSYTQLSTEIISEGFKGVIAITRKNGDAYSSGNQAIVYINNTATVCTVYYDNQSYSGPATDNAADVWIGRRIDGASQLDGRILYVGVANRAWSRERIQSIIDNPFSVYESVSRQIPAYQPADSILVPPYLSNPGVTNITTTGAQPTVKVEY